MPALFRDRLLLFTDGIPESLGPLSAEAIAHDLLAEAAAWRGGPAAFDDDLTLVVVVEMTRGLRAAHYG